MNKDNKDQRDYSLRILECLSLPGFIFLPYPMRSAVRGIALALLARARALSLSLSLCPSLLNLSFL